MIYFENRDFVDHFRKIIYRHEIDSEANRSHRLISVCILCMNRLEDIKQTLQKNLEDSESYQKAEFVLLDYNSSDGLGDWVATHLEKYLLNGRLIYYRTEDPEFYVPCHSKNAVARLARGDIIVNVDADNFIQSGYLEALNDCFEPTRKIIAISSDFLNQPDRLLLKGRIALYKQDFDYLGGYDEDLDQGWGSDDVHLVFRAILGGFKVARFDSKYVNSRIDTPNEKRVWNMRVHDIEELGKINRDLVSLKLAKMEVVANQGKEWGRAVCTKNNLIQLRPSRQYLKNQILPSLKSFQPILDIGLRSYSKHYQTFFENYVSVDINPIRNATITADVTSAYFPDIVKSHYIEYGCVLFNGMIGYGINTQHELETSLINFHKVLRNNGLLVVGWNENLMSARKLMSVLSKYFVPRDDQLIHDPLDEECHKFTIWEKRE